MQSLTVPGLSGALKPRGIVVFTGGSAANNIVDVFRTVSAGKQCDLSYIIPISDNGGSSSELIRVFGGPGIGDVRSRLVRLIPDDGKESGAIKAFFNHRLTSDRDEARHEWLDIVEARHELWKDISSPKKELIRSFLNLLNLEIVKRARPSSVFDFTTASIGNLFLTGARLFTGSFESAVYLLSTICGVPENVSVLPAVITNFTHHISAGLADGTTIAGQNAISHPSEYTALPDDMFSTSRALEEYGIIEDANLPGSLPALRKQNITFSKAAEGDLPARIERIWYINPYGQEIRLPANPKVLESIKDSGCVIYSIGSLYTSIIPSLILRGVGEAITSVPVGRPRILILNSTIDRETGPSTRPFSAVDFVDAIVKAASSGGLNLPITKLVTHIIHLEGPGTPHVDKDYLAKRGIETFKVYGRKSSDGSYLMYDEKALVQALDMIIGKRDPRSDRSRRNTLEK